MATQTAKRQRKNCREDARLEEEYNHDHSNTPPVGGSSTTSVCSNSGRDKDHNKRLICEENVPWLRDVHETRSRESADREETLSTGKCKRSISHKQLSFSELTWHKSWHPSFEPQ
jgi:hypothetical protein